MLTIRLPRLGGTRDAADELLDAEIDGARSVRGETVALLGRDLLTSSDSFADQIVKRLLEDESVSRLVLVAPPKEFEKSLRAAAEKRGFGDQIRRDSAASLGV